MADRERVMAFLKVSNFIHNLEKDVGTLIKNAQEACPGFDEAHEYQKIFDRVLGFQVSFFADRFSNPEIDRLHKLVLDPLYIKYESECARSNEMVQPLWDELESELKMPVGASEKNRKAMH